MDGLGRIPEGIILLVREVRQGASLIVLVGQLFDQIDSVLEFIGVPDVKVALSMVINPNCEG